MSRRILSVSYDEHLLTTRGWLLVRTGYEVTSVQSLAEAIARCQKETFDLFILGHSIPAPDKEKLIKIFRSDCPAPILSLRRQGDPLVAGANYHVFSDTPAALLDAVENIFAKRESKLETKPPPKAAGQSTLS